jgi:hypothetical protein
MKNIGFIGIFVLLAGTGAQADPRDDALSALQHCSHIAKKAQRLACYDLAAKRIPEALNSPALPPAVANAEPPPPPPAPEPPRPVPLTPRPPQSGNSDMGKRAPQTTVAEFGSESVGDGGREAYPAPVAGDTIGQISAQVVNYQFVDGYAVITLDNGQMWHETATDRPLGHLARPALSYTATIKRDSGDSYAMTLSGVSGEIPVRRIR